MNCAYFEDRLSDYLEHALGDDERLIVVAHLKSCNACSDLLEGVRGVIAMSRSVQVPEAPTWLVSKIVANTPRVVRITWGDWARAAWRAVSEPRFATAVLTTVLMLGWFGNASGISLQDLALIRRPAVVYEGVEGWAQRMYGNAVRRYYSSPLVNAIQCQINSGLERLRENT